MNQPAIHFPPPPPLPLPFSSSSFSTCPDFSTKIAMRQFDEAAKVPGLAVPRLAHYRAMIIEHVNQNAASGE